MTKLTLTREQHKAEIFWALKSVMSHFSYNSAHDITDVFKAMFPDSIKAQHMSCGPTKLSYLISFGIAPYFMDLLESEELSVAAARSTEEKRSSSMTKLTLTREQHKAEIFWALKSVMSHFSYNSAHDITDVFKAMFPDSIIAQHMSCGPTKLSYLISFGIAPYFMDLLLKELKDAPCFVISFDESFNEELEKEQMDFIVRYFKDGEVKSRYLSSGFIGHTTAKDLKRTFEECTEKLDLKNLIQVSMDGPNVNWKMLDLIVEDRNSNETYPKLLDVGSCSLHVVHGAFRTGMK